MHEVRRVDAAAFAETHGLKEDLHELARVIAGLLALHPIFEDQSLAGPQEWLDDYARNRHSQTSNQADGSVVVTTEHHAFVDWFQRELIEPAGSTGVDPGRVAMG